MPTEKEIISKLQALKGIKPRQGWVYLLKSEILIAKPEANSKFEFRNSAFSFWKILNFPKRSLAYSFATILLIMVGMFGFAQYTMPGDMLFSLRRITEQSQAALAGQTALRQNVSNLGVRINDLAQVTRQGRTANMSSAIDEVKQGAARVAESLKGSPLEDPQSAKELAGEVQKIKELQTLADITDSPEIKSLNDALATVIQNEIVDLEKTSLTEDQQKKLDEVKALYDKGDYASALERILSL